MEYFRYELKDLDDRPRKRGFSDDPGKDLVPLKLRNPKEYLYGKLGVQEFCQKLSSLGIDPRVEEPSQGYFMIHLENEDTLIQIEGNQTHIVCHEGASRDREMMRKRIRDALIQCLNKF